MKQRITWHSKGRDGVNSNGSLGGISRKNFLTLRFMSLIMSRGMWCELHHLKYLKQDLKRSIKHTVCFCSKRKCARSFTESRSRYVDVSGCIPVRYWKCIWTLPELGLRWESFHRILCPVGDWASSSEAVDRSSFQKSCLIVVDRSIITVLPPSYIR